MEKLIEQLELLGKDIRLEEERMAHEVRKHAKDAKDSFEFALSAVHRLHSFLTRVPERLEIVIEALRKQKQ